MGRWLRHHRSSTHRAPRPHRGWSTGVAILAAGLLLAAPLRLASPGWAVDDDQDDGLSISGARVDDYPEVRVTVNARRGVIDPAAAEDAFVLLENGQERDVAFQRLDSEDLEVALIIDTSGSMEGAPLAAAQQAALEFVESMPEVVQLSVIEFSTTASLVSDFTDERVATDGGDNRSSTTLDELTYTSEAFDEATVEVQLTQDGTLATGIRAIDLPPSKAQPEEEERAEEPEEEPVEQAPQPLEEEPEITTEEESPFADLLDEPWVLWTIIAAIVLGIAFLIFYIRGMPNLRS